jgi:hypothetical protein
MLMRKTVWIGFAAFTLLLVPCSKAAQQGKTATAKSLRCTFALSATGTWNKSGSAEAAVKPASLLLLFDSINVDEGTAQLRNGSAGSDIIVRSGGGYLNFIQSFRSGPLYTTTVFEKENPGGKLKAVHSAA